MSNMLNLIDIFESYPYNTLSRIVSNAVTPAINVKEYNNNYQSLTTHHPKYTWGFLLLKFLLK
jgi:hypothetical protein